MWVQRERRQGRCQLVLMHAHVRVLMHVYVYVHVYVRVHVCVRVCVHVSRRSGRVAVRRETVCSKCRYSREEVRVIKEKQPVKRPQASSAYDILSCDDGLTCAEKKRREMQTNDSR